MPSFAAALPPPKPPAKKTAAKKGAAQSLAFHHIKPLPPPPAVTEQAAPPIPPARLEKADRITAPPLPGEGENGETFERRAALLSFAGKLSRLSRLREFLKFLHASLPKPARTGEMILFYESRHFGLRTASVRRGRCLEKAARRPWPEEKAMICGDRAARLFLAQETGRPFSHVFLMPFPEISPSFAASPDSAEGGGLRPLLAIELAERQSAPQLKHFLRERREMISPVLRRLLSHTGRLRASLLWSRMFGAWEEPLAVLSRPENGEGKQKILRSNKAFKRLATAHPKRFPFPTKTTDLTLSDSSFPLLSQPRAEPRAEPLTEPILTQAPSPEPPAENDDQNLFRLQGRIYKRYCRPLSDNNRQREKFLSGSSPPSLPSLKEAPPGPLPPPENKNPASDRISENRITAPRPAPDRIAADRILPEAGSADRITADRLSADRLSADRLAADRRRGAPQRASALLATSGILYFQDMTERFHLRERLLQSEKMASIARLGKNMADRLNEPLEEIRSLIQPLATRSPGPDKTLLEMEQAALRCQTIIKSLLSFSGSAPRRGAPRSGPNRPPKRLSAEPNRPLPDDGDELSGGRPGAATSGGDRAKAGANSAGESKAFPTSPATTPPSAIGQAGGERETRAPLPAKETLVDLNQAVRAALPLLKTALAKPRLSIRLSPQPLFVKGDFSLLQQAAFNIILNGCQALEGRSDPELRIKSQYDKKSGENRLSIQDNGPGLSIERPEDVFQPFWTGRKQDGGTGLGLSIAQKAVQNCGGDISIETAPERGACFQIILPAPSPPPV